MERAGEARRLMAVCVSLGAVVQTLQVLTQIPHPPTVQSDIKINRVLLVSILGQLLYLFTLLPPSSLETQLPLRDRLFYDFHGQGVRGRDVFSIIRGQHYLFWLNTGETLESFLEIVYQTAPRRMNCRDKRVARRFNRELSRKRVKIEHVFKNLQLY